MPTPNGYESGKSYVVFGGLANLNVLDDVASGGGTANDGRINLANLNGTNGFVFNGIAYDYSGRAVSGAGDVNGDGFDDLLIGAPNGDSLGNLRDRAGASYVVFGKADWSGHPHAGLGHAQRNQRLHALRCRRT